MSAVLPTDLLLFLLTPPVAAAGLWLYDRDYRRHAHTRWPGVLGVLAAWLMPMLVLGYSMPLFPAPGRPIQYLGYALMVFGLVVGLVAAAPFRSPPRLVGLKADQLCLSGWYRYSRNPQYVFTSFFPAGYALTSTSVMAWVAVASWVAIMHVTVLVEERHLSRVFGDAYDHYMASTPRYLFR